jgi:hypothetical protein
MKSKRAEKYEKIKNFYKKHAHTQHNGTFYAGTERLF